MALHIHNLWCDANGESHWRDIDVEWVEENEAGKLSARLPATGIIFRQTQAEHDRPWHSAPRRQYIINLDAGVELTASDGKSRVIGAGEVMHRRVGVDLRLGQFANALAHAAEALLKRVVGAALAQQGVAEPQRRGDQRQWNENDQEPGKLLRQWLGAEGFEQCGHILRLVHDDETDRKHKQDNANPDELSHQNTQPHPTNVVRFGTTGARLAQAQAGV